MPNNPLEYKVFEFEDEQYRIMRDKLKLSESYDSDRD